MQRKKNRFKEEHNKSSTTKQQNDIDFLHVIFLLGQTFYPLCINTTQSLNFTIFWEAVSLTITNSVTLPNKKGGRWDKKM